MNDGAWHAWCFSWSNAGQIQVFKDGVKQQESKSGVASGTNVKGGKYVKWQKNCLRGPSTLTWELRTGESKTTLEDKTKIGNVTLYISSESLRDAESE